MTVGSSPAYGCGQPSEAAIDAAFDLAAAGLLTVGSQQRSATSQQIAPASLLKAVGWVESGWRQFSTTGHPVVSFDFGYGIMQITSGMAGAYGSPTGTLDPGLQSRIASDYRFNIAYGASMLSRKREITPSVGDGSPDEIETWYYALWAYNGWGWVNNPNNPRFSRHGNPASNPSAFPYQERVLYLVAHPPRDAAGNYLWQPVPVTLPNAKSIGTNPGHLALQKSHREPVPTLAAVYETPTLPPLSPNSTVVERVRVTNTGTSVWTNSGDSAVALTYDVLSGISGSVSSLSPFSPGVLAFGQGRVPLSRALLPGESLVVREQIQTPQNPGGYRLVWDLVQGVGAWFSQAGVAPHVQSIKVQAVATPVSSPTPAVMPTSPAESLLYVADTGSPDGTAVSAGTRFTKAWLTYNSGRITWKTGWLLAHVSGSTFGVKSIEVPVTSPCHTANIVATMRAPQTAGLHRGTWQMEDPAGNRFGQKLTVIITVDHVPVTPQPTPVPTKIPVRRTPAPLTPTPSG